MEYKTMTLQEKAEISMKAIELEEAGKKEEASTLYRTIPLPGYIAKCVKKYFGADTLLQTGWNLAEAEAEFGSDWLNQSNN